MLSLPQHRSPWMTEEMDQLRDMARVFFAKESVPHQQRWSAQGYVDREFWNKAGRVGLLCASIPAEYGGGGGGFAHEVVLLEEQGRALNSGFGNAIHSPIVAHYLLAYATEEQKRRWLPKMASGEYVGAIAMTEPGAGSDLQNVQTRAVRDGDHYVINGAKTFISNGKHCDLLIIVCKTDPAQGATGISLIVAETGGLAGFQRGQHLDKIGLKTQDTMELSFTDVRVPVANRLGNEGDGFVQLMTQLPQERLTIAVTAVAATETAVEHTIQYVKQRTVFGRPLLEFQNTRFVLAEAKTEATAMRVFLDHCIQRHLADGLDPATASMAKWWTTQKQCDIIDDCLQLFGGYGYVLEYPIAQLYADARVQKIYGGTNEIMKELIARAL